VSPLYKKKGSRFDVLSYRPISHLPLLGKLLEKMIAHKLSFYVETKLTNKQHGFRRHRSCMTAVAVLSDKITRAIYRKNNLCGAVFVDLRRAFDYVNSFMLLDTLHSDSNVDSNLLRLLNSYFTNRHYSIKLGDYTDPACNFNSACPQGSVLAPLLFSVFINDLSAKLPFDHIVFTDDLIFFTDTTNISL